MMRFNGYGCKGFETVNICTLQDVDFEAFLQIYDPPTRTENNKIQQAKEINNFIFHNQCQWNPRVHCP